MIDKYRIYIAHIIAPLIGLLTLFTIWSRPTELCSTSQECFGILSVSVILIVAYLLYIGMFLTGITRKASNLYSETGLPFWKLAIASTNYAVLGTIFATSVLLFSRWPEIASVRMHGVFVIVVPLLAVFVLYLSWYLIVGRNNKEIRFDAQKDRTFTA